MKQPIVKLQALSKLYTLEHGLVHALKGIDLTIFEGESVAIMGPSGSGKSTLLHLLGCLDRPSTGKYFLNHQDISLLDDQGLSRIRSTQIGFVFQSYNLIPQLNIFENLEVPFLYQTPSIPEEERQGRIMEAIGKVGLEHRLTHLPAQLSGGEAQRVAIARALALRPLILLADEPTGNLDRDTGRAILQLFEELHQQGSTLVIVTHDAEVGSHCNRIVRMQDGSILTEGFQLKGEQTC